MSATSTVAPERANAAHATMRLAAITLLYLLIAWVFHAGTSNPFIEPTGQHHVEMRFVPRTLRAGFAGTGIGFLMLGLLWPGERTGRFNRLLFGSSQNPVSLREESTYKAP